VLVSELVTNAVVHSHSSLITCTLMITGGLLRIEVTDQGASPTAPVVRHAADDEMTGRGLLLVSLVSQAWGASPAIPQGWAVWATVRTTV
jgi:anti-sigma regulatory factor (Ser/Thr protein kinase)